MIIAIDGPAGSGKSSVARIIARKLHYNHIDTGAMYRAVAWKARQQGIDLNQEDAVCRVAEDIRIELVPRPEGQQVLVDGENVTGQLQNEWVGRGAATVAGLGRVRKTLVAKQQEIGKNGDVVMDGRDIGTVVFPHADLKFFLDADPRERGKRRYLELKEKNPEIDLDTTIEQVQQRDHEDRNRKVSPLKPADDAILLDTTHLNIDQVVTQVMNRIQAN